MSEVKPPEGEGYDLQRVYAEQVRPFWFRWADRWWQLPHLKMLDYEVQARIEAFDFGELTSDDAAKQKINELFDLIMGPEQGAEWRTVTRPANMILDMIRAWAKHSGTEAGEAPASSGSSASTGRPSKPTSTASTASASRKRSPAKKAAPRKAAPRKATAGTARGSS